MILRDTGLTVLRTRKLHSRSRALKRKISSIRVKNASVFGISKDRSWAFDAG